MTKKRLLKKLVAGLFLLPIAPLILIVLVGMWAVDAWYEEV